MRFGNARYYQTDESDTRFSCGSGGVPDIPDVFHAGHNVLLLSCS